MSLEWKKRLLAQKGYFGEVEHQIRILPGQEGLAFPKVKRVKVKPRGPSEKDIQQAVDDRASMMDLGFIRIPGHVYDAAPCAEIGGIADNVFLYPLQATGCRFGLYYPQELKRRGKKPRKGQKEWMAKNGGASVDTAAQAYQNMADFLAYAKKVDAFLKTLLIPKDPTP